MNPYALSGTAPSRRRVYLFHHLGSSTYLNDSASGAARKEARPVGRMGLSLSCGFRLRRLEEVAEVSHRERRVEVRVGDVATGGGGLEAS